MALPPLPPGATLVPPAGGMLASRSDPLKVLRDEGFTWTNGYRTEGDVQRIREQGYKPASDGPHNRGDGIDLTHPRLSPGQQAARLKELFGDWDGAHVLDEGHHRHLALPGWGAAPGTPGTPEAGIPPLPEGATLVQRGSLAATPPMDETAARIATIRQNGFAPAEEARLIRNIQNEPAPLVDGAASVIAFNDELPEAVAKQLTADQAANWFAIARDPNSTADDLRAVMKGYGFDLNNADDIVAARSKGLGINSNIITKVRPAPANPDGAVGAAGRGFADPFNVLDEMGAVVDTFGGTDGRENVWNSERSFKDILYNNIDQNRGIIAADERDNFEARFGGQLASGILLPYGAGARGAAQLARIGAVEGAAAGFGAGEGNPLQRAPNAAVGAALGATGGYALGQVVDDLSPAALRGRSNAAAEPSTPDLNQVASDSPGLAPFRSVRARGALFSPQQRNSLSPELRSLPPLPPGATLVDDAPLGRVRPIGEQASPEDIAAAARSINPEDVRPIPNNWVEAPEELPTPQAALPRPNPNEVYRDAGVRPRGLQAFVRANGRLADEGGELRHMGLPKSLIHKSKGVSYDDMSEKAWEAGYFAERPTVSDFLEALRSDALKPDEAELVRRFDEVAEDANRFDAARDAGTPLVEDRGVPVSLDDLKANEPPATAYEDLPKVGGRVGNINLAHVETRNDIRRLLQNVESRFGGFDAARRGKMSQGETAALASELGMTPDDLLKRRKGQALNAEQALAARQLLAKSSDEVTSLAKRMGEGPSDEERAAFAKAIVRHAAIHEQVTGATAEAGRALAQFKMAAKSKAVSGRIHKVLIDSMGGEGRLEDVAARLLDLQREGASPGQINRFTRNAMKPSWRDMPVELFYASILSAPTTHALNVTSNVITSAFVIPELAVAAGLGAARNIARSTADRVAVGDVAAYAGGIGRGVREGLRLVPRVFRTGEDVDLVSKIEARAHNAIPGKIGHVVRTPLRALAAEDAFFKAIARQASIGRLAHRAARKEGLSGQALAARTEALILSPSDEMLSEAGDFARYLTFQDRPGVFGSLVLKATNTVPELKYKIPFVRTLGNLLKYAASRTPAGLLMPSVLRELRAGGERRDVALARMLVGSAIGWSMMEIAEQGIITGGGPMAYRDRQMLEETGWRPYSVKIGDRYVSYRKMDPFGTIVSIAADLATYHEHLSPRDQEKAALSLGQLISRNISESFWLESVSELFDLAEDPAGQLPGFVGSTVGALAVPNIVAQPLASYDPVQRDQRADREQAYATWFLETVLNRVRARVPGLRDDLPARTNALGEPIRNDGRWGPDIVSPFPQGVVRDDPVINTLIGNGLRVGAPHNETNGVRHTHDQQRRLTELSGRYIREDMRIVAASSEWKASTPAERKKWFEEVKSAAREAARAELRLGSSDGADLPPLPAGAALIE